MWITRARRLGGQELAEVRPSIRLAVAQGVLSRGRRHKGYCYEGACEEEMSTRLRLELSASPSYNAFALDYPISVHIAGAQRGQCELQSRMPPKGVP